jgi:diacylglycerol kinase (ATP)
MELAVVISPQSRRFRHDSGLIGRLSAIGAPKTIVRTATDGTSTRAFIAEARSRHVGVIGVAGGDGSLGHIVAALRDGWTDAPWPALAILRGGTMNTVANGLGLARGTPDSLLKQLLKTVARARASGQALETIVRPTIDVAGRLGFLFGTGVFRNFLDAYYEKGQGDPSVVTAAATIAHTVASTLIGGPFAQRVAGPVAMTVEADGEIWPERRFLGVNAGTVAEVGLGFRAFHLAHQFEGAFHLMGLTASASEIVVDLPRVWLGRGVRGAKGRNVAAREAVLRPVGDGGLAYMVDGDLYTTEGPLRLTVGPKVAIVRL